MDDPSRIRALEVVLTAGCNLRCSYCYQSDKKARSMEWDTLQSALDLVLARGSDEISILFIGGEPLQEFPAIEQAVAYLEERRPARMQPKYTVITNGTLFNERHADFFARHGFNVQLSFDGVPAVQNLRGNGTFEVLDGLLDHLRRTRAQFFKKRVRVAITLLPQTIPWLPESVDYFLQKGVQEIRISPAITATPEWRPPRISELERAFEVVFNTSLAHFRQTGEIPMQIFRHQERRGVAAEGELPMCAVAGASKIAVDVNGQVNGCVTFAESYQAFPTTFLRSRAEALKMGTIDDPSFAERFAQYRTTVRETGLFHDRRTKYSSYGKCADCTYLATCSVCPASIGHQPGANDPDRVPDFICAYNLVSQKYRDQFPAMPGPLDMLLGLTPIPGNVRDLFSVKPAIAQTQLIVDR